MNMGIIPMLEVETPVESIEEVESVPERDEVCKELTSFMRRRMDARNVYKRGTGCLEMLYNKQTTPKDNSSVRYPAMWPDMVRMETRPLDGKNLSSVTTAPTINRVELKEVVRYGGGGLFSGGEFEDMNLHPEAESMIVELANCSLATTTWKSYASAIRATQRCGEEWSLNMMMPWTKEKCINFISWCRSGGMKSTTCRQYLAGVKKMHQKEAMSVAWAEDPRVTMILRGYDNITGDVVKERVAMDPKRLWFLKLEIKSRNDNLHNKRMLWFTSVIMLKASLRASEIMGEKIAEVNLQKVLRWGDIERRSGLLQGEKVESLIIKIKAPKEQKNLKAKKMELFQSEDFLCPVYAFDKYKEVVGGNAVHSDPVARWRDGSMLTKTRFNKELKEMLSKHFEYQGGVSSHSFRAGLPTLMSEYGCSEQEMMDQGRWSSSAFAAYLKSGRSERRKQQLLLSRKVEEMIGEKMK